MGGIPVSEAVVVTWIIMAVLVVVSFILTRNLKVDHISKRQAVAESIVTGLMKMVQGIQIRMPEVNHQIYRSTD